MAALNISIVNVRFGIGEAILSLATAVCTYNSVLPMLSLVLEALVLIDQTVSWFTLMSIFVGVGNLIVRLGNTQFIIGNTTYRNGHAKLSAGNLRASLGYTKTGTKFSTGNLRVRFWQYSI